MAAFCGLNYDELKSMLTLTVVSEKGSMLRKEIDMQSEAVHELPRGTVGAYAGETFRSRDGYVRIRTADGQGYTNVQAASGLACLSPPPRSAVEGSTKNETVTFVTLRVKTHRFIASYRALLFKLGFKGTLDTVICPAVLSFQHDGIPRAALVAAFEPLVQGHLDDFYAFPIPNINKQFDANRDPEWWKYELWMEYKKEIAVWAD